MAEPHQTLWFAANDDDDDDDFIVFDNDDDDISKNEYKTIPTGDPVLRQIDWN